MDIPNITVVLRPILKDILRIFPYPICNNKHIIRVPKEEQPRCHACLYIKTRILGIESPSPNNEEYKILSLYSLFSSCSRSFFGIVFSSFSILLFLFYLFLFYLFLLYLFPFLLVYFDL